ncbi:MAG: hypothetical protein GY859_12625 [Desulfobacterales bacterium]|nr:hypothetical protein [Desulfobacterales bacterium]
MDKSKDHFERRCPRLGGDVSFKYCRTVGNDELPCWKTADCWWERFDVMTYLRENVAEDDLEALLEKRPKPKVLNILELIEQAKNRVN